MYYWSMFGFFFKKNMCDVWDNLFYAIIVNFFVLVVSVGLGFVIRYATLFEGEGLASHVVFASSIFLAVLVLSTFYFAGGENAMSSVNYNTPRYGRFFARILPSLKEGLFCALFISVVALVAVVSMPFYFRMWRPSDGSRGSLVWFIIMVMIFWFIVTTVIALQWFMPVRIMMKNGFFKCLKKSYILFFDNIGFTMGLFGVNILNVLLTAVTFGLFPGLTGITVTNMNALKLRMYKYDWIEVNPDLTLEERRNVPWEALLAKDKKTLGPRTLKSYLFPWREK